MFPLECTLGSCTNSFILCPVEELIQDGGWPSDDEDRRGAVWSGTRGQHSLPQPAAQPAGGAVYIAEQGKQF
jgi:hypothetical protein